MDDAGRQELIDWVQRVVPDHVETARLREMANESNLSVEGKQVVMDLPDREWSKPDLADEVDSASRGGKMPTGGIFPTSGSPV